MADGKHGGTLGAVYEAKGTDEVAALYDRWSETYDHEMAVAGYRHPSICLALLARHLPRGASPLLDAGAGTGLIGEWLAIMGYAHVEALDISEGMLAQAAEKGGLPGIPQACAGRAAALRRRPFRRRCFRGRLYLRPCRRGRSGRVDPHMQPRRRHRADRQEHALGEAALPPASPNWRGRGSSSAPRKPSLTSRCPARSAPCRAGGWC